VDSEGEEGVDEWIEGGVRIWGEWCADKRCVRQVCVPAEEAKAQREKWYEVAKTIVEQNECWTDLVATVLVVAAQKQAEQGERSNWLLIAKAWAGRVVVKIKSHIDKIRETAREKEEDVPDYPQEEVAVTNMYADVTADIMQKDDTPEDVWWVPRTGATLQVGFTVCGRWVDGCVRGYLGTLCHRQVRHQLGLKGQRGVMSRWQEAYDAQEAGDECSERDGDEGIAEGFRVLVDMPQLRAGMGTAHTLTTYSSGATRLATAMNAGRELLCVAKDQRVVQRTGADREDIDEWQESQGQDDGDEAHELAAKLGEDADCMTEEDAVQCMRDIDRRTRDREAAAERAAAYALDLTDATIPARDHPPTRPMPGTPGTAGTTDRVLRDGRDATQDGSPITRAEAVRSQLVGVKLVKRRTGYEDCTGMVIAHSRHTDTVSVRWQSGEKTVMTRSAALRDIVYVDEASVSDKSAEGSTAHTHEKVRSKKFEVGDVVEIRQCELINETRG
jgi:hypothetical protein